MLVIGELINCTRKKVGAATAARDANTIRDVALKQAAAGAHMLDVNGGLPGQEVEALKWLVRVVQEVTELPLCLDSCDPAALAAALPLCKPACSMSGLVSTTEAWSRSLRRVAAGVGASRAGQRVTVTVQEDGKEERFHFEVPKQAVK